MKFNSIMLIGLFLPAFGYSKSSTTRIKKLEEASYSKALELQKIAKQIREMSNFWPELRSFYEDNLYEAVQKNLKEAGIDIKLKEELLTKHNEKIDIHVNQECPIYSIVRGEEARTSTQTDPNEKNIEKIIYKTKESIIAIGNDVSSVLCGEGTFEHDLIKELFDVNSFDILKFFFTQGTIEIYLLTHLVDRYQACLHEFLEINKKILTLKKESI